jgi:hypothetical protein
MEACLLQFSLWCERQVFDSLLFKMVLKCALSLQCGKQKHFLMFFISIIIDITFFPLDYTFIINLINILKENLPLSNYKTYFSLMNLSFTCINTLLKYLYWIYKKIIGNSMIPTIKLKPCKKKFLQKILKNIVTKYI